MRLPLRYYGDPILREKAKEVDHITDEIKKIAQDMIDTMLSYDGIGIAAPQVGYSLRIFISRVSFEDNEGEVHLGEPQVYINPKLSKTSKSTVSRSEGCLSIPGIRRAVTRPVTVSVEALDLDGNLFKKDLERFPARVIMHENDHLNGVLFVDRLDKKERKELDFALNRIKTKYHSN